MKIGYVYIAITAFIFSTMEIVGKSIAQDINPFQLTFLRFLIGGIVLLPFAIKEMRKREIKFAKEDLIYFTIMGLLFVVVSMSFFQFAVLYTKASIVAVVFSTNPIFTVPLAYFILKEKVDKLTILSIALSLVGMLFILNPLHMHIDNGVKGIVLAFLAALMFSLYSILGKKKIEKYGGLAFNCWTFLIGDLILLVFIIIYKIPIIQNVSSSNMMQILYMGVFVTGLGYVLYFKAMEETSAILASTVFFIKPALAPILALIILKEKVHMNTTLGIVCILIGSYITILSKKIQKTEKIQA